MNRGIERETLRTDGSARLSLTPHPASLGNKLTHPSVTTDFSESQLELITPVFQSVDALLQDLTATHQFVARQLGEERLWPGSMPCILPDEQAIPLADYGLSNLGRLKKAYRNGLGLRYNRIMQTICAVHYNFSMSDADWDGLRSIESRTRKDEIRCSSILRSDAQFQAVVLVTALSFWRVTRSGSLIFNDEAAVVILPIRRGHLLFAFCHQPTFGGPRLPEPYPVRSHLHLLQQLGRLRRKPRQAITTPHADYEHLAERHGAAAQISPHILQSEAEFYTTVRAKTAAPPGENFLSICCAKAQPISRYGYSTSILLPTLE